MESQGSSILVQQLLQNVSPVIMILSTQLAEAACRKNNLRFLDLLRPFCILDRLNVPVRTTSENSYRLQDFRLRLFYSSEIRPTPIEAAEEQLLELVSGASQEALNELQGDPQQLEVVRRMVQAESTSSWFQKYSSLFTRTLAFSDHESFDHPVACLFVVSSLEASPANAIAELSSSSNLPPLLNEGVMDPRILKHYVVLQDNQDDSPDRAEQALQDVCGAFEPGDCSLIRINSSAACSPPSVQDLWSPHLPPSKEPVEYGSCLQAEDVDEIQRFVINLCQKHVIPYMEQKVRLLNDKVAATRKGLKNQIKNLWWRKKDSEVPETPVYTYSSLESQIRVLADHAFMLRDYELAVSSYRLLSSDYKADKSLKRYAGVMEMIGICLCLLDQSRKEADSSMEAAYISYQICGGIHARYATRTAIWWAEVHKARSQFSEAAYVLFRAATEMDKEATLRAGVLLEQSAYCYLRCVPPMLRKYGFHLVLAGIRYYVSGQRTHAIRAYMSVISVYEGQGWNFISDHVNLHLGRISLTLGQLNDAVQYFLKLLSCSHQSAPTQALFLKEFLGAAQNNGTGEIPGLSLPAVSSENVHVRYEDHRTYGQQASSDRVSEDVWSALEEGLVPVTSTTTVPSSNWLDAPKASSSRKLQDYNISVAGEDVLVYIQVKNPLQIAIEVSSMELICEFQGLSDDSESKSNVDNASSVLQLSKETFTLRGLENIELALKVKPLEQGLLQVLGVRWILFGVVHGRFDFPTPEKKNFKSKKQREIQVLPHKRLKFQVVGQMPRLEVSMHELPHKMNKGEIRRAVLEIHNPSSTLIKNLTLKTSHPGFLLVGHQGDLDLEFPKCLEDQQQESKYSSDSIFSFPESLVLEPTSTILWPIWLHATSNGELTFRTSLYFESSEVSSLKFRTVRMAYTLQVISSLHVSIQITPSPAMLDRYLVRMDVTNAHSSESCWLRQASCVGDGWKFTTLEASEQSSDAFLSASVSPTQLLPAGQSSSYFFQLRRNREEGTELNGGHVSLGPAGSNEPVIDINSGPLSYFHQQEKLLQATKSQASVDERVDVVLITSHYDERPDGGARFASHHICHRSVDGPSQQAIVWALEGPRCIGHDFEKQPVCEVPVEVAIRNCSKSGARVFVETGEYSGIGAVEEQSSTAGWRSVSPPPSLEALASAAGSSAESEAGSAMPCGSYMWSANKSATCLELEAGARARVPLRLLVFAAGMFDVCDYRIKWKLEKAPVIRDEAEAAATTTTTTNSSSSSKSKSVAAPATRSDSSSRLVSDDGVFVKKQQQQDEDAEDQSVGAGPSFLLTVIQVS